LGRQLDLLARHSLPAGLTVMLMLLVRMPFRIPDQATLLPVVTIASIYFWSVFRPTATPAPVVFLIGLLLDLLTYLPMGVGELTLLVTHALVAHWRPALTRQGFRMNWLAFAGIGVGTAALCWSATTLLSFRLLPLGPALFQALLTAAAYPALAMLFLQAHRAIAGPTQA
jgi:rod shape-determining protein MreD